VRYLLDTSVLIPLRDGDSETLARVDALGLNVVMSIVSLVELEGGVYRDPSESSRRRTSLDEMLDVVPVLPFGADEALAYRTIVIKLGYSRRKILDRMIAAQAMAARATLITYNADDFAEVADLSLEAWN
jgi:predicted nucleic acid-binding protein